MSTYKEQQTLRKPKRPDCPVAVGISNGAPHNRCKNGNQETSTSMENKDCVARDVSLLACLAVKVALVAPFELIVGKAEAKVVHLCTTEFWEAETASPQTLPPRLAPVNWHSEEVGAATLPLSKLTSSPA